MVADSEETLMRCDNCECGFIRMGKKLPKLGISCLKALVFPYLHLLSVLIQK
jgi:hypothetical protein